MGGESGTLRAGEWKAMEEGTWEKVQTHRRGKAPLLGTSRGGGVDHHRKLPALECVHARRLSESRVALGQATALEKPLACLGETGCFLCRLPIVARHLLCGLRA